MEQEYVYKNIYEFKAEIRYEISIVKLCECQSFLE